MKKPLIAMLVLLLMLSLSACKPKPPVAEPAPPTTTPVTPSQEQPEEAAAATEPVLTQVNIYHLGIQTSLDINEAHTIDLAQKLRELLDNAAATDSMEEVTESALNPIQIMSGQTALELIYDQDIELPLLSTVGEPLKAQRLLYWIPSSSSEGGLLYTGHDIYDEAPLGRLFDQDLQNDIYNNAADQVEQVTFDADGHVVMINGQEYTYVSGSDDATELSGRLLNRMLFRAIAFYLNAYTGNVTGLQAMSTSTLFSAVQEAKLGSQNNHGLGEEVIANLNQHLLADNALPQSISAPVKQGEDYVVFLQMSENTKVELHFSVEEDVPLVSAMYVILADQ